jgi:hypothetical protein
MEHNMAEWADALPAEDQAYLATKGWDKHPDAATALPVILNSYKAAESKIGAPPEAFVKWPGEGQPLDEVYKRLGVPEAADKYTFEGVTDETLTSTLRNVAFATKLTPAQAQAVAKGLVDAGEARRTAAEQINVTTRAAEDVKLRAAWGGDYDTQLAITERFLETAPFTAEQKAAFTATAAGRQVLYAIADKNGEAKSHGAGGGGAGGGQNTRMSPQEATAEFERLKNDSAWYAKYRAGDAAAVKQFTDITQLMTPRRA